MTVTRNAVAVGVLGAVIALVSGSEAATKPGISVPAGFTVDAFVTGLSKPTALAFGPDGRLYVTQESGEVVGVDTRTRRAVVLATGFRTPLGLAWLGRWLYVSSQGRLDRLRLVRGQLSGREPVLTELPYGLHQQDNVVVGRDGRLYLGSGSTCNACREKDERSAVILSFRPDGSDLRVVARGLRNPFGLAVQPGTGRLFVSVNGRDDLDRTGDPEPAEEIVLFRPGAHYGWPDCWPSARLYRMVGSCRGVEPPVAYLEPHSSADGIVFYDGRAFPRAYWGNLFVAEWGQYYSDRFGRRVTRIVLGPRGRASSVSTFADGFEHPLAVAIDPAGALLVADHGRGTIYRIRRLGGRRAHPEPMRKR